MLEFFYEKETRSSQVKHIDDFDCAEAPTDKLCDSYRAHIVVVPFSFQRILQLPFRLLGEGRGRTRHLISLRDSKQNRVTLILLRTKREQLPIFAVQVFVAKSLDDVFVPHFASSGVKL